MKDTKRNLNVDISRNGSNSIAGRLEPLISKMESMSLLDMQSEFNTILDDPETSVAPGTRNIWRATVRNTISKSKMMFVITNLYLAGAKLKL